jgi:hypothetical protein
MEKIVQDHEIRISQLEKNDIEFRNSLLKMENTIMSSSNTTNTLLNKLVDHHFADKQSQTLSKTEMMKAKFSFWGGIFGAGGAAFLVFQWVVGLFQ